MQMIFRLIQVNKCIALRPVIVNVLSNGFISLSHIAIFEIVSDHLLNRNVTQKFGDDAS